MLFLRALLKEMNKNHWTAYMIGYAVFWSIFVAFEHAKKPATPMFFKSVWMDIGAVMVAYLCLYLVICLCYVPKILNKKVDK